FMRNPEVLLVDEPFVGLDPHSIRLIHNMLKEKAATGTTILLTTHILAFAESLADRIGIIFQGKLIASGSLQELKSQNSGSGSLEDLFLSLTSGKDN
ncbi:MAG: AAA family ATPase, partial [Lentisphaerae bacterium]|nr:AAA family ATPase [Lentisphaerota bacterium]